MPRLSVNVFLLAFIPVLIAAGWVVVGHQPNPNWARNHVLNWSDDIGILGVVRDLAEYVSVLAFGIGLVFGYSFDTMPRETREPVGPGRRTAVADESSTDGVVHTRDDGTPVPMRDRTADGTPVTAADTRVDTPGEREPVRR